MITFENIRNFFPEPLRNDARFRKYMLMEYIQLTILDYLSASPWIRKIVFIGGTSIRLTRGIDRFSEDLDFDCKELTQEVFTEMTDGIVRFLNRSGFRAETRERDNPRLKAFRRSILFPEILYNLGLSGHRDERLLVKVEAQDQKVAYQPEMTTIRGCGYFFPMPVPAAGVLSAMKVTAMLDRQKGRDFYDVMFLLQQAVPDFDFLEQRREIPDLPSLKKAAEEVFSRVDLRIKKRDIEHLLFNPGSSERILHCPEFFKRL